MISCTPHKSKLLSFEKMHSAQTILTSKATGSAPVATLALAKILKAVAILVAAVAVIVVAKTKVVTAP